MLEDEFHLQESASIQPKTSLPKFFYDEIRVERAPHLDGVLDGLEAGLRLREGLVVVHLVLLPKSRLLVDGLPNSSLLLRALFFFLKRRRGLFALSEARPRLYRRRFLQLKAHFPALSRFYRIISTVFQFLTNYFS